MLNCIPEQSFSKTVYVLNDCAFDCFAPCLRFTPCDIVTFFKTWLAVMCHLQSVRNKIEPAGRSNSCRRKTSWEMWWITDTKRCPTDQTQNNNTCQRQFFPQFDALRKDIDWLKVVIAHQGGLTSDTIRHPAPCSQRAHYVLWLYNNLRSEAKGCIW